MTADTAPWDDTLMDAIGCVEAAEQQNVQALAQVLRHGNLAGIVVLQAKLMAELLAEVHAEPGFEGQVHAFNMFAYVSRSDVTWNPSVVSCVHDSQFCATTEEHALPIMHGNRAIGILYGDNAEHRAAIDSMTGLEIFLSQAGYAFGNAVFAAERAGKR